MSATGQERAYPCSQKLSFGCLHISKNGLNARISRPDQDLKLGGAFCLSIPVLDLKDFSEM